MENIRFFGPYTPKVEKNERIYALDSSNDPLWNVVKILFPSTGGTFGPDTTSNTNLGRYVKGDNGIKFIANLLIFAHEIRKNNIPPNINEGVDILLNHLDFSECIDNKEINKRKSGMKNKLQHLLENIQKSIDEEKTGKSLYPYYTTEQAILALFVYKYDEQKNIWEFINNLSGEIVDFNKKSDFPKEEDLLKKEDIDAMLNKKTNYNLDEAFAIGIKDVFDNIIPYRPGVTPLNNAPCKRYNRKEDKLSDTEKTFADCVEITLRHFVNIVLFNPDKTSKHFRQFDLTTIEEIQKKLDQESIQYKRLQNLREFYQTQTPNLANAGDINIRSQWNRVVGDLNYGEKNIVVMYSEQNNNMVPGFFNLIRALQLVLNLDITPFPDPNVPLEKTQEKVEKSLEIILKFLNPKIEIVHIDVSKTKLDTVNLNSSSYNDLFGSITIKARHDKKSDSFSFCLAESQIHSKLNNIIIDTPSTSKKPTNINLKDIIKNPETIEESLLLLSEDYARLLIDTDASIHPFYKLYPAPLYDNELKLKFIETFIELWKKLEQKEKNEDEKLLLMLTNILDSLSLDDDYILQSYSSILNKYLGSNNETKNETEKETKNDLETIFINHTKDTKYMPIINHQANILSAFGKLKLTALAFSEKNQALEKITIFGTNIGTNIPGLDKLPALQEFNAMSTKKLTTLEFSEKNQALEKIDIQQSEVNNISGLDKLPALKTFLASSAKKLTSLAFSEKNQALNLIGVGQSGVKSISGLDQLPALKTISACYTEITKLEFSDKNTKLTSINLRGSTISEIKGLQHLHNLKEIVLTDCKNLKKIYIKPWQVKAVVGFCGEIEYVP